MSQRASLSVPSPSPETSMNLGSAWASMDWNSDGFCVNTDGRVWLDAQGSSSSTLSVLANGGSGLGQLLLQSLTKNVYIFAQGTTFAAANGSMLIAGGKSVKIAGALGIDMSVMMALKFKTTAMARIAPSTTDPSSDAAQDYVDIYENFADWSAIADVTSTGLALLCDGLRLIGGAYGSGGKTTLAAGVAAIALVAKTTAGLVSSARLYSDGVPGFHVNSVGSINIGTMGFCSMYAGLANLLMAPATSTYGLDAHIMSGVTAGLRSLFYVKLEGKDIEVVSGLDVEVASRTKDMKVYAADIQFGALGGEGLTQIPTATCKMEALGPISASVTPGKFEMVAGASVELSGASISYDAAEIVISAPAYEVKINAATGVSIHVINMAKVNIDTTALTAELGTQSMEIAANGVRLGSESSFICVDASGAWSWKGPLVAFV